MTQPDIRLDFPALHRQIDGRTITYLDNAATTLKPRCVIEAITRFYSDNGANIHRGKHYLSEEASDAYEGVRTKLASFLGAYGNEIVFVKNTTEALNLVAHGLALEPDDIVLGCLDAHHSQLLPWRNAAQLKLVRVDRAGRIDLEHYHELLRLRPKVVALTHCSNVTGAIAPIDAMAKSAKQACGATVVVDAAQSLPHVRVDMSKLAVDFLAFSGHKLLAPTGIGVLCGRREALEQLRPLHLGGGMADWVDADGFRARKIPHRFEAGTPPIAAALGLGAAIDYLAALGETAQRAHDQSLTAALVEQAARREYVELIGPTTTRDRAAIATLRLRGCPALSDVARALSDAYGIMCRSGHLCAQPIVDAHAHGEVLRASAYIYNTTAEVTALFEALDELVPLLM